MSPSQPSYHPLSSSEKELESEDGSTVTGNLPYRARSCYTRYYLGTIAFLILSNFVFAGLWLKSSWMLWHERMMAATPTSPGSNDCVRPKLIYSPASSAIRYEKKRLWRDIDGPNPFTGKPRPEFDEAWKHIIEPITVKVSAEELTRFSEGDSSIAFKDGSGYLAELGVYHELHCVKRVRRFLYLDHYYPNMTKEEREIEDAHMDHCLEYWRQSAMCRGDVTMGTFFWRPDGMATSRVYTDNECVDWQALDTWARKRMVNTSDYSLFVKDD